MKETLIGNNWWFQSKAERWAHLCLCLYAWKLFAQYEFWHKIHTYWSWKFSVQSFKSYLHLQIGSLLIFEIFIEMVYWNIPTWDKQLNLFIVWVSDTFRYCILLNGLKIFLEWFDLTLIRWINLNQNSEMLADFFFCINLSFFC